ncbi:MAG: Gfo/Idh/MocA family oxidoreductase [Planctomycetaceae bacterium]
MSKVRWGVLSTAKIGTEKVLPAMQRSAHCEILAIASRDIRRAETAADNLGISRFYGSYEEVLADRDVEAIYNPLPNHMHVEWSIKALEAGKHVLCEKPIALSAADGQRLVTAGKQHPHLKLMEAFMYRHHPRWQQVRELLGAGEIGSLRVVESHFSYTNLDADNIRNRLDVGGGALMDIGCYPISASRWLFNSEPTRALSLIERDPEFGTDRFSSAILDFESGRATLTCATQMNRFQWMNIIGTTGRISLDIPYTAWPDQPCHLWIQRDLDVEEIVCPPVDQYTLQGDAFSRAILEDTRVTTPIEDAVLNMKVIEAIFGSAGTGTWATV